MNRLDRLLRPRHIAVFGSGWALNVIEQCRKMGFSGDVWPVHPSKSEIGGLKAYPSLEALPEAPDAVFLGVNRHVTVDLVRDLARMGAGGATCFAAGWEEAGEGALQEALVAAAGEMPILGPNCYGVINYLDGALLWPDQHGGCRVPRGVALISQSSNILVNLCMQKRGLPIAYAACLGNAAVVGLAELSRALLEDDRVTALGLYIEGIDDARAFAELAHRARLMGKPVVAIKSGKTPLSQQAAASHTASLAGSGAASSAYLRQLGIAEVDTPEELVETLKIFHIHGAGIGTRLCSLSCSGGEAGMMADLAQPYGLDFPEVPETNREKLAEILGPIVTVANPLDYNTFIWGDLERTSAVFTTMLEAYDAGLYVIDMPRDDRCDPASYFPALQSILAAQRATGKPAFPVASLAENFGEARALDLMAQGLCPLMGFDTALAAIRAAQVSPGSAGWLPLAALPPREVALLSEAEGKAVLAREGVPVPRAKTAKTLAELRSEVKNLTAPLALKGLGFAHKTEAGAVKLGVMCEDDLAEFAGAEGYLLEEMVTGVVAELLLGLRRDPVYGVTLTIGMGGVTAEVLADTQTLIWPVTQSEILAALQKLRLWPLLDGYRGRARADVAAFAEIAVMLGRAMARDEAFEEIEINPVLLRETGAVAVDALIRKESGNV